MTRQTARHLDKGGITPSNENKKAQKFWAEYSHREVQQPLDNKYSVSNEKASLVRKSVYLTREIQDALKAYCQETGLQESVVIRQALEKHLKEKGQEIGG